MKKILKEIHLKNLGLLCIAGMLNAIGVTLFLAPVHLFDSGISGTAMLFGELTPPQLTLSFFLLILNIPLFIYGYQKQGAVFTFYAIYSVCIYALTVYMINNILSIDVKHASPFAKEDLFLCAVFGGLIAGMGTGMAIRFGGALDGIDILAVIFCRGLGITVGTFAMIYNVLLYIVIGMIFQKWTLSLYSIVTFAVALKTMDFIVDGLDKAKAAMIITTKKEAVCKALSNEFGSGITVIEAKGYYSDQDKTVVYFVVNRFQIVKLKKIVKTMDRGAFIAITEISEVL